MKIIIKTLQGKQIPFEVEDTTSVSMQIMLITLDRQSEIAYRVRLANYAS